MEEFNLNKHTVEEIPGKYLTINGVQYIFRHMIKEGENAWIYLLQHAQSGYSRFVGKVLKLDNQSELYQQISRSKVDNSFRLNLETNSNYALHTEIYEVNGTLLKFQQYLGGLLPDKEEAYQPELMKQANAHTRNSLFQEAIEIYNQVLEQNPYHTDALLNIAASYAYLEEADKAINSVLRAIEIDPNYRACYFQLAKIYQSLDNHELAIKALELTLDRWAYDSEALTELIDICLEYDLMDKAVAKITFIHDFLGLSVEDYLLQNPELKEKIIISQFRIRDYNKLLGEASEQQHNSHYKEAENLLAQAIPISRNNVVAEFNYNLCQFHQRKTEILSPLLQLYSRINDPTRQGYCLLLSLLTAVDIGIYPLALNLVEILGGMLQDGPMNKYDLPRIPLYYYEFYAIENPDFEPILDRLNILKQNIGNQDSIDFLYGNYQQLAKEWASTA